MWYHSNSGREVFVFSLIFICLFIFMLRTDRSMLWLLKTDRLRFSDFVSEFRLFEYLLRKLSICCDLFLICFDDLDLIRIKEDRYDLYLSLVEFENYLRSVGFDFRFDLFLSKFKIDRSHSW